MTNVQELITTIERWLGAERRRDDEVAERALGSVFVGLPMPRLDAAFADRIVSCLGPAPVRAAARWTLERLAAVVLVMSAVGLWMLPWWLGLVWARSPRVDWAGLTGGVARVLSASLVDGAALLAWMVDLGHLAQLTATRPAVFASILLCGLLAATGSRLLHGLLNERNARYVD